MMMQKLRAFLLWKQHFSHKSDDSGKPSFGVSKDNNNNQNTLNEALQRKDKERVFRSQNRRRVRGGAPAATSDRQSTPAATSSEPKTKPDEDPLAEFWATQVEGDSAGANVTLFNIALTQRLLESEYDDYFGLVAPEETVVVRAYSDDSDDRMLAELQPRFIVMYEPNMDFIRRVEVYRSSYPGLGVRVYHMVYGNSCEEYKYLAGIRKEKSAFERLIKERAVGSEVHQPCA